MANKTTEEKTGVGHVDSPLTSSVSPDDVDLLIAEQLKDARPLSEIDLQSLEESNKRVCAEILLRKKPNNKASGAEPCCDACGSVKAPKRIHIGSSSETDVFECLDCFNKSRGDGFC